MTDTENTGFHENLLSAKRHQDVEEITGSQGHLQDGGNACVLSVHFPLYFCEKMWPKSGFLICWADDNTKKY